MSKGVTIAIVLGAALAAGGCLRDDLVQCGDGRACPVGTVCASLAATSTPLCASADEVDACRGAAEFTPCEGGTCYATTAGLICLPGGCGNGIVDPDEVCDDGNAITGDGCSRSCLSDETCGNGQVDPLTDGGDGEECDDGNRLGHDGCTSTCQVEQPIWARVDEGTPDAVYGASIAYDSARQRVVLFGGSFQAVGPTSFPVPHNDTWEWDGAGWARVPTAIAPSKRAGAAMAYDPIRRHTVLFGGGANAGSYYGDTWIYDGTRWSLVTPPASPSARLDARAFYDPARETIVLFGGIGLDSVALDDTWEWNGSTWTPIPASVRPPARHAHGLAYDPRRGAAILVGGLADATTPRTDCWQWREGAWSQVGSVPGAFVGTSLFFDGQGLVAFGGYEPSGNASTRTFRLSGTTWTEVTIPIGERPPPRVFPAIAFHPVVGRAVMFGGRADLVTPVSNRSALGDTLEWTGAAWTTPTLDLPVPRAFAASAYDSHRGRLIVFGGSGTFGPNGTPLGDTWEHDGHHWIAKPTSPSARAGAAMAYDEARRHSVLFGGRLADGTSFAETWVWDGTAWSLRAPAVAPSARSGHAMAYDPIARRTLVFGGVASGVLLGDTWQWDGDAWSVASPATSPPPRAVASMVFDPRRGRVVLFGGESEASSYGDAWEWDRDLGTWVEVSSLSQRPAGRGLAAMAFHAARGAITLFGGASRLFTILDDTWELGPSGWVQQPVVFPPAPRQGAFMQPLPDGSGVAMVSGMLASAVTGERWVMRWLGDQRYETCELDVDDDGDGLAGCEDPDCWTTCTPLCPPGAAAGVCDPAAPRCGDGSCNARETCRSCATDCGACPAVCGDQFCDPGEDGSSCPGDCP